MDESDERDFDILPVQEYKSEILSTVLKNEAVICIGETGSGSSSHAILFRV